MEGCRIAPVILPARIKRNTIMHMHQNLNTLYFDPNLPLLDSEFDSGWPEISEFVAVILKDQSKNDSRFIMRFDQRMNRVNHDKRS
jgi:hypothetical protein